MKTILLITMLAGTSFALPNAVTVREAQLTAKVSTFLPLIETTITAASTHGDFSVVLPMANVGYKDLDNVKAYLAVKGYKVQDNGLFYDKQAIIVKW